jgi:hypothetical protein
MPNPIQKLNLALSWHKERHRPTGFGFTIADSIDFIDPKTWDDLTSTHSFFLTRAYLRALEQNAPTNMRLRYALIFDQKKPAAAVVMQTVDIAADTVAKKGPNALHAKALICGNLFTWGRHGTAFAPDSDPQKLWPGVAEALYRVRQTEKLSGKTDLVMVKDLDGDPRGAQALERFSYNSVETDPDMVLSLDTAWKTFDDYLAGLHSKYRKNAVKIAKDLSAAGCRLEPADWSKDAKRIYELYLQVHDAAKVRPVTAGPGYLAGLAQAAGPNMRTTVVRRGESVLGFVTTIKENEETAIGYHIGFERDTRGELPLYFALLQATVGDAIILGCRRLSLGRTALEPKAKLGARPNPMRVWVRHANPMANILVKRLLRLVHHDEAPDRNPFKEPGLL